MSTNIFATLKVYRSSSEPNWLYHGTECSLYHVGLTAVAVTNCLPKILFSENLLNCVNCAAVQPAL
jgi:hypothetical protein